MMTRTGSIGWVSWRVPEVEPRISPLALVITLMIKER